MSQNRKSRDSGTAGESLLDCAPAPASPSQPPTRASLSSRCIFTVDVEDWFHILDVPSAPPLSKWSNLPSRVERNFLRLLDLFAQNNAHVTCFFLGWVAEKYRHLVREAQSRGHEVASHGYAHKLVYEMTSREFLEDARAAKNILEDIAGLSVQGYRASGFSVTEETPWYFEMLMAAGYHYDSSVFPAPRGHGGMESDRLAPYAVAGSEGSFIEFPITIEKILGRPFCFFGGGYLRLFPYFLIKNMTRRVIQGGRPAIFYVHPREIDPHHPRLPMGLARRFKSYVNLDSTESKIRRLLNDFNVTTFKSFIHENQERLQNHAHDV